MQFSCTAIHSVPICTVHNISCPAPLDVRSVKNLWPFKVVPRSRIAKIHIEPNLANMMAQFHYRFSGQIL